MSLPNINLPADLLLPESVTADSNARIFARYLIACPISLPRYLFVSQCRRVRTER